jgi:hypothetical protein
MNMAGDQRLSRSNDQLQMAARHVGHKIRHLVDHAVQQVTDDKGVPVVFLEASLAHARNLIEFFACPGKR